MEGEALRGRRVLSVGCCEESDVGLIDVEGSESILYDCIITSTSAFQSNAVSIERRVLSVTVKRCTSMLAPQAIQSLTLYLSKYTYELITRLNAMGTVVVHVEGSAPLVADDFSS